jgi:hypothetical protein
MSHRSSRIGFPSPVPGEGQPHRAPFGSVEASPEGTHGRSSSGLAALDSASQARDVAQAIVDLSLAKRQEAAHQTNQPLHGALEEAAASLEKSLSPVVNRLEKAREMREAAHGKAARQMGLASASYDRKAAHPDDPFRPRKMSREEAIHELGLVEGAAPTGWLKVLASILPIPVGALFALSFGIKSGLLDPELTLNFEPDRLGAFVGVMTFGIGIAYLVGLAMEFVCRFAAEQRNSRGWNWQTWTAMAAAGLLFIFLVASDSLLQAEGLLSIARAMNLGDDETPGWVYLIISMVVVVPYLAIKGMVGAFDGLRKSCDLKAGQLIAARAGEEEARRRACPLCQEASADISIALRSEEIFNEAERERLQLEAKHEALCRDLRSRLIPIPGDLAPDEKLTLREADLRVKAAQADVDEGGPCYRGDSLRRQADEIARRRATLQ